MEIGSVVSLSCLDYFFSYITRPDVLIIGKECPSKAYFLRAESDTITRVGLEVDWKELVGMSC